MKWDVLDGRTSSTNRAFASNRSIKISASIATTFRIKQPKSDAVTVDLSLRKTVIGSICMNNRQGPQHIVNVRLSVRAQYAAGSRAPHLMLTVNAAVAEGPLPYRHMPTEEITRHYPQALRKYHPHRVAGLAPELVALAERRTKELNAAYSQAKRLRNRSQ
jgi:hypothetical protein